MADSIIDLIKKNKAFAANLQKSIDDLKEQQKQQPLPPDKQKKLQDFESELGGIRTRIDQLQKQFETDKADWEKLSSEFNGFSEKLKTVTDWGAIDVKAVKDDGDSTQTLAKAENYREAINRFKECQDHLAKPYDEYQKQFAAKGKYDTDLKGTKTRLEAIRNSKYQTEAVKQGLATLDKNLPTAEDLAAKKDYVAALDALKPTADELGNVEKTVQKAQSDDTAIRKDLEAALAKVQEVGKIGYEELRPRVEAASDRLGKVVPLIDAFDHDTARSEMAAVSDEVEAIKKEAAKLDAEKKAAEEKKLRESEEWQRQVPRFEALKKQIGELEEFGSPEAPALRKIADEIAANVTAEDFVLALDGLAKGEHEVKAPWDTYLKQREAKKSYDSARPELDKRAEAAHADPEAGGVMAPKIADLDTDLTYMKGKADAKDFLEANTKLAGATKKLDQIERDLRDLAMAAKVAADMGVEASSPEVQQEIKRRIYLEEQPIAKGRMDKIAASDLLGGAAKARFEQLTKTMSDADGKFKAATYPEAVADVRTVIDELPAIEDLLRKQAEAKNLYLAAEETANVDLQALAASPYKTVVAAAGQLSAAHEEARSLADAHDFEGALAKVGTLRTDIEKARADETAIAKEHAEVTAALAKIQTRLDAALAKDLPALKPLQGGLTAKRNDVDAKVKEQDFKAALKEIATLTENLENFEKEAEKIEQKTLYESAVVAKDLDARAAAMAKLGYPEAKEQADSVTVKSKERKDLAASESYETARLKVYEEEKLLDALNAQKDRIEQARDRQAQAAPALAEDTKKAHAALVPPEQKSEQLDAALAKLTEAEGKLSKALTEKRFIEAETLAADVRAKAAEAVKIKFDSTKIDEALTNVFIDGIAGKIADNVSQGAINAVLGFRDQVTRMITDERGLAKAIRWGGFALNLSAAVASVGGPEGAMAAAVLGAVSNTISMIGVEYDDYKDGKDKEAEARIINGLTAQAAQVKSLMNRNYAQPLKANNRALYDEVGRHVTRGDTDKARAAMNSGGIKVDVSVVDITNAFTKQLEDQMKKAQAG